MKEFIKILGVKVNKVSLESAVERVKNFLLTAQDNKPKVIFTPNTEMVTQARNDSYLKNILNSADLVIADGIGLIYASKIKKNRLPERVTGFDLSMEMIKLASEKEYSLFLLGGEEGVAKKAGENLLEKYPNLKIAGHQHGYFKGAHIGLKGHEEEKEVLRRINESQADILFVGFGVPRQEIWINENKDKLGCKVMIGNGGTIDIIAGKLKRAPVVFQKLGLEWLYRLIKEPKRIKRQILLPLFVLIILFSKDKTVE